MTAKLNRTPGIHYDEIRGVCEMDPAPVCEAGVEIASESPPASGIRLNASHLAQLAASGSSLRVNSLWQSNPLFYSPLALPTALQGCSEDPVGPTGLTGDPIASIDPLGPEVSVNADPIMGKVRQTGIAMDADSASTVAWSVSNTSDLDEHGTYAAVAEGSGSSSSLRIAESPTSIPRDTSVARMGNGDSVVVFSRIEGDDAPSSLVAVRLDASGSPLGEEIEILPSSIRTGFPQGQVLPLSDGFLVVFRDGEGNLASARYDESGVEQGRDVLGSEPLDFQITAGTGDQWALAEISGSNEVRVRRFSGSTPAGVDHTFSTNPMPPTPRVSIAMQDDGAIMVAWNALLGENDPILQGNFLTPSGSPVGDNLIFRDLIQGGAFASEDHINSHALTTDHRGNFILAFEENRNLVAYVYNGSHRDGISLTDISTRTEPSSGPYADLLSGLSNTAIQNVDVRLSVSPDGLLSFIYNKIFTGEDGGTGDTLTFQSITRRDFEITYE